MPPFKGGPYVDGNATRIALAKAARKGSEHLAKSNPGKIVKQHGALLNLSKSAAAVHGWSQDQAKKEIGLTLNLLNLASGNG